MATFYFTNDSYELQHHGILGMKWGVRRYQNSDGSLTEAGKKRYFNIGKLSDADLDRRIERLKKEQELKRLTKDKYKPVIKAGAAVAATYGTYKLTKMMIDKEVEFDVADMLHIDFGALKRPKQRYFVGA